MGKLAGRIQHTYFGIPGGEGLFSPIQVSLKGKRQWLSIIHDQTQHIQDWEEIIKHMGRHTTQVRQMVKNLPHYIG